jgi:hypothetical protein
MNRAQATPEAGIKLGPDGRLIAGQHVLAAIIQADIPATVRVTHLTVH